VSEVIRVLAVIAITGYVIGRQLMGEPLRGPPCRAGRRWPAWPVSGWPGANGDGSP